MLTRHRAIALHEDLLREEEVQSSSERSFGLTMAAVFTIVWLGPLLSGRAPRWWSMGVAVVFFAAAIVAPRSLTVLNRIWGKLGLLMHQVVNFVVMGLLYFVALTPMGLLRRRSRQNPISLGFDAQASSYWIPRTAAPSLADAMKDQF